VVILFECVAMRQAKRDQSRRFRETPETLAAVNMWALLKANDAEKHPVVLPALCYRTWPSAGRNHDVSTGRGTNRAGVEKVDGVLHTAGNTLCFLRPGSWLSNSHSSAGWNSIISSSVFAVSEARQKLRFKDRREDPLKQWKLSPIDERAAWRRYGGVPEARNEMLPPPGHPRAPFWTIVKLEREERGPSLAPFRSVLTPLTTSSKTTTPSVSPIPRVVRTAHSLFIDN